MPRFEVTIAGNPNLDLILYGLRDDMAGPARLRASRGAGGSFDSGFLHQFMRGAESHECLASGDPARAFSAIQAGGTEAFPYRVY
jgi:sugar/nucleoside kinase (ribokinase family)